MSTCRTDGHAPEGGVHVAIARESNLFMSLAPTENPTLNLAPETQLDRFHIVRMLGRGSLGAVYLAYDQVTEHDVAVKIAKLGPGQGDELALLLRHEKTTYNRVQDHHHVLRVNDIYVVQYGGAKLLLLSLEYAEGGSLRQWLTAHLREWSTRRDQGLAYFKQSCRGVAALHESGVSHLDPKPENFLFVGDVLKVCDLGTSVLLEQRSSSPAGVGRPVEPKTHVGTPSYMSPEHFTAMPSDLDCRSDIYSLGILLYETLSRRGRPPFQGDYSRLRDLHTRVPPPSLEGAGDREAQVVSRCLQKDPAKRYQTVADMLDDLESSGPDASERGPDHESRIQVLWDHACRGLQEARPEDSRRYCRQLLELCRDHAEASEMLAQLDERFEEAGRMYSAVGSGMNARSLDELLGLVSAAAEIYPNHPTAATIQIQLEARSEQYRITMEEGLIALRQGSWEHANAMFQKARTYNPGAVEVDRAIHFVSAVLGQREETRRLIDEALTLGASDRALVLAEALDEYLEDRTTEVTSLIGNGRL